MFNERITKVRRKLVTKLKRNLIMSKCNAISCRDKLLCTRCPSYFRVMINDFLWINNIILEAMNV